MRAQRLVWSMLLLTAVSLLPLTLQAQRSSAAGVPSQVRFSGVLQDATGTPRAGTVGILFAIYSEPRGGAPLWQETQNVQLDLQGRYAVLLGSGRELPKDIFTSTEARWLGVQVLSDSEPEQARVLLVSVPYALKAQDSDTLGGRPASAYALNIPETTGGGKTRVGSGGQKAKALDSAQVNAGSHTINAIPKFSAVDTLADSLMFEQYTQPATNAFGQAMGFNEDVVRVGDGTGLAKRVQIAGRLVALGFDINTNSPDSVHVVNSNSGGFALQVNAVSQSTDFTNGIFATAQSSQAIGLAGWVFDALVPTVSGSQYTYGVWGQNYNPTGAAVFAAHVYDGAGGAATPTPTGAIGLYASTAHSSAIPGVFDQRAGSGTILSARFGGTQVMSVNTAGTVTATAFSGNGSGLTNVTGAGSLASDPAACPSNQFVTDLNAAGTLTCAQPSSGNLSDGASLATIAYADAGDASLAAPQYVTLAASATLTSERVLTAGKGIALTSGVSTVTVDNKVEFAQTSVQGGDTLSSIGVSGAVFATNYVIPANTITAGSVIEVWASGAQVSDASGMSFGYGVDLGSTAVLTSSPLAGIFMNANTTGTWTLTARIICTGVTAGTATFEASGVNVNSASASAWSSRNFSTSGATVDATVPQTLSIRELVNTNGSDTATMRTLIVKILK